METTCYLPVPEHAAPRTTAMKVPFITDSPLDKKRFSLHSLIVSSAVTATAFYLRAVTEDAAVCHGAVISQSIRDTPVQEKSAEDFGKRSKL